MLFNKSQCVSDGPPSKLTKYISQSLNDLFRSSQTLGTCSSAKANLKGMPQSSEVDKSLCVISVLIRHERRGPCQRPDIRIKRAR